MPHAIEGPLQPGENVPEDPAAEIGRALRQPR
jgi:hypothetical protein